MAITFHEADLPGDTRTPEELFSLGWVYRDINWLTEIAWNNITSIIGEENYKILIMSQRRSKQNEGKYDYRGQFLISPAGIENCTAWAKSRKMPG